MSIPLLDETAQLRWWSPVELNYRDDVVRHLHTTIQSCLTGVNKAWQFFRTEGPALVPRRLVAAGYNEGDLWTVKAKLGDGEATLRPETTATSFLAAKRLIGTRGDKALPLCVWQVGKSYRQERNDGASANKLRFFEFTQAEWQCIYGENTGADYRAAVLPRLLAKVAFLTGTAVRTVPSDRLPAYSLQTDDIEVLRSNGRWTEVASISTRTDFAGARVLEIAFGLDRMVDIASETPGIVT